MRTPLLILGLGFLTLSGCGDDSSSGSLAGNSTAPFACQSIASACAAAGFKLGTASSGTGVWADCVRPVMNGQTGSSGGLTLPTIDPSIIQACSSAGGAFGSSTSTGTSTSTGSGTSSSTSTSTVVSSTVTNTDTSTGSGGVTTTTVLNSNTK